MQSFWVIFVPIQSWHFHFVLSEASTEEVSPLFNGETLIVE